MLRVFWVKQGGHPVGQRLGLAGGPDLHVCDPALALDITRVDREMRRLDRREGVQLEGEPRVAGADKPVVDKPGRVAEMAAQAFLGAGDRLFRRVETGVEVVAVAGAGDVRAEPGRRAAVAGLAADAVGKLELPAALVRRHVVGVAIEADLLVGCVGQADRAGNADGAVAEQHGIGAPVLIALRPDCVFVSGDRRVGLALAGTVAVAAGAGCDAEMDSAGLLGGQGRHQPQAANDGRKQGYEEGDGTFAHRRHYTFPPGRARSARAQGYPYRREYSTCCVGAGRGATSVAVPGGRRQRCPVADRRRASRKAGCRYRRCAAPRHGPRRTSSRR